jgi:hypothetical protein
MLYMVLEFMTQWIKGPIQTIRTTSPSCKDWEVLLFIYFVEHSYISIVFQMFGYSSEYPWIEVGPPLRLDDRDRGSSMFDSSTPNRSRPISRSIAAAWSAPRAAAAWSAHPYMSALGRARQGLTVKVLRAPTSWLRRSGLPPTSSVWNAMRTSSRTQSRARCHGAPLPGAPCLDPGEGVPVRQSVCWRIASDVSIPTMAFGPRRLTREKQIR